MPNLPLDIGFEPWTAVDGFGFNPGNYTNEVKQLIGQVATEEVEQDVAGQCDLDSMYFGGKQLDKYAYLAMVTHFVLQDQNLTGKILPKIKAAIEKYASNQQQHPCVTTKAGKVSFQILHRTRISVT